VHRAPSLLLLVAAAKKSLRRRQKRSGSGHGSVPTTLCAQRPSLLAWASRSPQTDVAVLRVAVGRRAQAGEPLGRVEVEPLGQVAEPPAAAVSAVEAQGQAAAPPGAVVSVARSLDGEARRREAALAGQEVGPAMAPAETVVLQAPAGALVLQVEAVQAESAESTEAASMAKAPVLVPIQIPASAAVRTPTHFWQVSAPRRRGAEQTVESGNRISSFCPTVESTVRDVRLQMAPCLLLPRKSQGSLADSDGSGLA